MIVKERVIDQSSLWLQQKRLDTVCRDLWKKELKPHIKEIYCGGGGRGGGLNVQVDTAK